MIDLFEEPYRISINQPAAAGGSRTGLLLGLTLEENELRGIVLGEDGVVTRLDAWMFTVDFRYNAESDRWVDVDAPKGAQEDQEG